MARFSSQRALGPIEPNRDAHVFNVLSDLVALKN
jgi:hypothetical protein